MGKQMLKFVDTGQKWHLFRPRTMLRAILTLNHKASSGLNSSANFTTSRDRCQTHYEVLGISRTASQKEIKDAYLKLSKEFHPDRLAFPESKISGFGSKFLTLSEAYSVLSRPKEKKLYDLGLHGEESHVKADAADIESRRHYRTATYEDRVEAMGYPKVDPRFFKRDNRHYHIAAACVAFIVFGFVVHLSIIQMMFDKHRRQMDKANKECKDLEEAARQNSLKFGSVREQWADLERRRKEEDDERKK